MAGTPNRVVFNATSLEEALVEIGELRSALQTLTDRHANLLAKILEQATGTPFAADVEHLPAIRLARLLLADPTPGEP